MSDEATKAWDEALAVYAKDVGTWETGTRTMEFVTEATIQGRPTRWREVTQCVGDDQLVTRSFFRTPDGGEHEMVTVAYRRRPE